MTDNARTPLEVLLDPASVLSTAGAAHLLTQVDLSELERTELPAEPTTTGQRLVAETAAELRAAHEKAQRATAEDAELTPEEAALRAQIVLAQRLELLWRIHSHHLDMARTLVDALGQNTHAPDDEIRLGLELARTHATVAQAAAAGIVFGQPDPHVSYGSEVPQ